MVSWKSREAGLSLRDIARAAPPNSPLYSVPHPSLSLSELPLIFGCGCSAEIGIFFSEALIWVMPSSPMPFLAESCQGGDRVVPGTESGHLSVSTVEAMKWAGQVPKRIPISSILMGS